MSSIPNDWKAVIEINIITEQNPDWNEVELENILKTAIKTCAEKCMESNDAGWIFTSLSGGLDSSFCLAVIRQLFPKAIIKTFTIGGNEKHPDIQSARVIAKQFNTFHTEIMPAPDDKTFWLNEYSYSFPGASQPTDGDIAVFVLYQTMCLDGAKTVITHDGIDELLGGYWPHRGTTDVEQESFFRVSWMKLVPEHLKPLQRDADHFGIQLFFPYLQLPVVKYIVGIPVDQRTSRAESKIPLRNIARKYLPPEIIEREKKGFCDGLKKF